MKNGRKTDWRLRFWSKVEISENGCWIWKGGSNQNGYGLFKVDGKTCLSTRLIWELTKGELPDYLCVLHVCDNPSCVRPDHLLAGTRQDNVADRQRKNRQAKGEDAGNVKLTEAQVQLIRGLYHGGKFTQQRIADLFDITQANVSLIVNRTNWRHVA